MENKTIGKETQKTSTMTLTQATNLEQTFGEKLEEKLSNDNRLMKCSVYLVKDDESTTVYVRFKKD